jgi:signal transduction histidine kinase
MSADRLMTRAPKRFTVEHMRRRLAWLRERAPDPVEVDRLLAILLTAMLQVEAWHGSAAADERLPVALLGSSVTAAVALRRAYPATVGIGAGLVAVVVAVEWGPPSLVSWAIAWMCCVYALAAWSTPRRFAIGLTLITVAGLASAVLPGSHVRGSVEFSVISGVVILLVRRVLRDHQRRVTLAERERDVAAREAVVEERARIARELHDVVAHAVSMIVVQAGAERRVTADASAREVLATVERLGRDAVTEMRRLVGMLRAGDDDPLTPQPGLDDLPTLVTHVRDAGLPVELTVEGEPRRLPAGIELSAYRIVQEALTNALKHAGDASANVSVRYGSDVLELEIADDGRGGEPEENGGHGLVGMRERVALYGGWLDVRRDPAAFVVRATLPTA